MSQEVEPGCISLILATIAFFVLAGIASELSEISQTLTQISERI